MLSAGIAPPPPPDLTSDHCLAHDACSSLLSCVFLPYLQVSLPGPILTLQGLGQEHMRGPMSQV